jgi:hypothetical protein
MNGWLYISREGAYTCALIIEDDYCVVAPPIARWAVGKPVLWLHDYFAERRGFQVVRFDD